MQNSNPIWSMEQKIQVVFFNDLLFLKKFSRSEAFHKLVDLMLKK